MKIQMFLIVMIAPAFQTLTAKYKCDCAEIVQYADCKFRFTWLPSNSSCIDTEAGCTKYTTQQRCNFQPYCAWDDSISKCGTFTACSHYIVPVAHQCYAKHPICEAGEVTVDRKIQ